MTERETLARIVAESGVDLTEDGVGSPEENALRIADALIAAGWSQGPGAPANDVLAANAARNALLEILDERSAHTVADQHTVTWERDVNSNGVAVRRYVLRGEWQVDPERGATRQDNGTLMVENDHIPPTAAAMDAIRKIVHGALAEVYDGVQALGQRGLHSENEINRYDALMVVRGAMHRHGRPS